MTDAQQLADQYVTAWTETDPAARRQIIAALWAPDGCRHTDAREARGHAELERMIADSHQRWVRERGNRFRALNNAQALRNAVTFDWQMLPAGGDSVLASGREFLILDEQGRVVVDYQFITRAPS